MKELEKNVHLLTNPDFQKVLSSWESSTNQQKEAICKEYGITVSMAGELYILWLALDLKIRKVPDDVIEAELESTIWKISENKKQKQPANKMKKLYLHFSKIAAILIIPIILYTVYNQFHKSGIEAPLAIVPQQIQVKSSTGTVGNLVLPDGSTVYLNSGSNITYPSSFVGKTRNVSVSGEAFFNVVSNKKKPMIVEVGNFRLKVYGTSFNINSFSDEDYTRFTLVEGKISLSSPTMKIDEKKEFFIEPGQTVTYYKNSKKLTVDRTDPLLFTSWKDGFLTFRNTPFSEVAKKLSRKFNVEIYFNDPGLKTIPMDGTFTDESLSEILRLISLGTPFGFRYAKPEKQAGGTFAKSKIYIYNLKNK
jgi:hypothetical protein